MHEWRTQSPPSGPPIGLLRQRAMFLLGGLLTGIASYLFAVLADWAQIGFGWVSSHSAMGALIWTPAGFALSAFLPQRVLPGSSGSGIPQCIAALGAKDGGLRDSALSARMAVGKIGLTAFGLLCGASIRREGPTVQIGASVMLQMGKLFHREQKGLILAGAVTILAGLTATALGGNYSCFGYVSGGISSPLEWVGLVIVALAGGGLGGLYRRCPVPHHLRRHHGRDDGQSPHGCAASRLRPAGSLDLEADPADGHLPRPFSKRRRAEVLNRPFAAYPGQASTSSGKCQARQYPAERRND